VCQPSLTPALVLEVSDVRDGEPGRKRRHHQRSITRMLWLIALGSALALAVQVLLR
jgi:hypothetical protein